MHRMLYKKLTQATQEFLRNQQGVTAIEYAFLAATIAALMFTVFNASSGPFYDMLTSLMDAIAAAVPSSV